MVASQESAQDGRPARSRKSLVRVAGYAAFAAAVGLAWYLIVAAPIRVLHHTVQRGPIVSETMGTGTLEARVKATISPKIASRVERVLVDQGDHVKAGQTLVTLDNAELLQQVEIANASVAVAKAGLDRLTADKDRALAVLDQARFDFNRTNKLYKHDTAASVELEKATEAHSIARAELARAEAAIVEGQKEIIAQQKTLAYHEARLADTVIAAPFDGLIVRRYRDSGDVVVPGSPVLTLISTEELWISAWVDETEMASIRPGQSARVIFRSQPERAYAGTVSRLGREADRETREFVVDVRVLELPENWAIGQRAELFIETARREGVSVIPATYVLLRDGVVGVYVEQNERAIWRSITIGLRSRNSVEVIDGLEPSDTALIPADPKKALIDGRRVRY